MFECKTWFFLFLLTEALKFKDGALISHINIIVRPGLFIIIQIINIDECVYYSSQITVYSLLSGHWYAV